MQAVQYAEYSKEKDVSAIKLVSGVEKPVLNQSSCVLVKIHAASINPGDFYVSFLFSNTKFVVLLVLFSRLPEVTWQPLAG